MLPFLLAACTPDPPPLVVATWNTGTTPSVADRDDADRYTPDLAATSDAWYGDGLAWLPAIDAARAFLADVRPDVIGFQEIFWTGACPDVPEAARDGFACAGWTPGDPTVVQLVLGAGYQVACHPGKPDKCLAVHADFGTFEGCDADLCLDGLDGVSIDGCGTGARVGRGVVLRTGGDPLTVVHVHGSSGLADPDEACRVAQVEQVFVDLDGRPGADGAENLVLGDLNTDPGRFAATDPSAARWTDFVGPDRPFRWITDVGPDALPTYAGVANIDHVASDTFSGSCWAAGVTPGRPPVLADAYFDHAPIVCTVSPVLP